MAKKIFIVVLALVNITANLKAQGGAKWATGLNSSTTGDAIGTNNNMPLIFKTNGQEAMRINETGTINLKNTLSADSLRVKNILGINDSSVHIGDHSIILNYAANVISWTPTKGGCGFLTGYNGMAIANGTSFAKGSNSMVFGNNVNVLCGVANAYVIGNGLTNSIANSFQLGWSATPTVFADATGVAINGLTAHAQTLDVNGTAQVRSLPALTNPPKLVVADNNGFLQSLAFSGNSNQVLLGNGTFGTAPASTTAWLLGGNSLVTVI